MLQKDLVYKIVKITSHGECLFLFGPPGVGKTLLLGSLTSFESKNLKIVSFNGDTLAISPAPALSDQIEKLQSETRANPELKILVTVDHLDQIRGEKFQAIFLLFKSLRETARNRIGFVFASDTNFKTSQLEDFGPIKPYLIENTLFIGPLNKVDSQEFTNQIALQFELKLEAKDTQKIIVASGGLPRIIKRLVKLANDKQDLEKIIANPKSDPKIEHDLESLVIFFKENPDYTFPVPILNNLKGSSKSGETILDVNFKEQLTRQEHDLFVCLQANMETLVSREDLIKAVWPKNLYETSEHALDQMIHRLRKKLESATPKYSLTTFRGRGAKLSTSI